MHLKLVSNQEIKSVIQDCKWKVWQHVESKPEHQQNNQFIEFMENRIKELNQVLKERNAA